MNLSERESKYFLQTYNRLPIEIDYGEGVYLVAKDGTRYLDMFAGLAVNALGYNHPAVRAAILHQTNRFLHLSNSFYIDVQVELAEKLISISGFHKLFFSNSGSEAMEGALKLSRKWGRGRGKSGIVGFTDSFHGRTLGSLSITGRQKYREGFDPFLPNASLLRFNNCEDLESSVSESTLAVVLEFFQGEGGVNPVTSEFADMLVRLRQKYGFLIIADEIQSGLGRTGKVFGFMHHNITPDIVVVAKALGGGLPLGAFLVAEPLSDVLSKGSHGSTFGGNPVACAAGLATLTEIFDNGVMKNAARIGAHLKARFDETRSQFPQWVKDVRGEGLMLGVELQFAGTEVLGHLLRQGVLANLTNEKVLRWLPPLILTEGDANRASEALKLALQA